MKRWKRNKKNVWIALLILTVVLTGCGPHLEKGKQDAKIPKTPKESQIRPKQDPIKEQLDQMTTEEKLGQLFIVGFPRNASQEQLTSYFSQYHVGGFIFFSRNFDTFEDLYTLTNTLKEQNRTTSKVPLFFALDEEGGTVSRMPPGGTKFPDMAKVGALHDATLTEQIGRATGQELAAAGINMDCAPVLDVLQDAGSSLLRRRAFGRDPQLVANQGCAFLRGLQSAQIISIGKHFPGHGGTSKDSHATLPVISKTTEQWHQLDLIPFQTAAEEGIPAIMVGHLAYPQIDPSGVPATRSKVFLTEILRKELHFQGLAITDDIEMAGFLQNADGSTVSLETATIDAFNSGIDIFLACHRYDIQQQMYTALQTALADGRITSERLNESVYRILKAKDTAALRDNPNPPFEEAKAQFSSQDHRLLLQQVNEKIRQNE